MSFVRTPLPTMPTVEEMQRALRQNGILDKVTIFPNKREPGMSSATQFEQIHLANAATESMAVTTTAEESFSRILTFAPKVVSGLLMLQGLRGIYTSLNFILVEFPELEIALENHLVTGEDINHYVSKAVVLAIHTFISIMFAMHLAFLHTKAAKAVKITIGIVLLLGHSAIENYFNQQNSGVVVSEYSASLLEQVTSQVQQFFKPQ
jgi:hypothetical protein